MIHNDPSGHRRRVLIDRRIRSRNLERQTLPGAGRIGVSQMKNTLKPAARIDAPFAPMEAKRKQSLGKFRWLLVSLIVWATATAGGYAHDWDYRPKKSWEYQPKKSWEYHPRKSWEYQPKKSWEYHPKKSWEYHPKKSSE